LAGRRPAKHAGACRFKIGHDFWNPDYRNRKSRKNDRRLPAQKERSVRRLATGSGSWSRGMEAPHAYYVEWIAPNLTSPTTTTLAVSDSGICVADWARAAILMRQNIAPFLDHRTARARASGFDIVSAPAYPKAPTLAFIHEAAWARGSDNEGLRFLGEGGLCTGSISHYRYTSGAVAVALDDRIVAEISVQPLSRDHLGDYVADPETVMFRDIQPSVHYGHDDAASLRGARRIRDQRAFPISNRSGSTTN